MSFLTADRAAAKLYRSDDAGAPALDSTAGCLIRIFKACLSTGYGDKVGAGWLVPFTDGSIGASVFQPPPSINRDFYLQLSADTGAQAIAQVYTSMTGVNNGDLKMQCSNPYKYGIRPTTRKWVMIVSGRGVWFFSEQNFNVSPTKTGSFFFVGDLCRDETGVRPIYMQHTGGSNDVGAFSNMFGRYGSGYDASSANYNDGRLLLNGADSSINANMTSLANGAQGITNKDSATQAFVVTGSSIHEVPALLVPLNGAVENNLNTKALVHLGDRGNVVCFGHGTMTDSMAYISVDEWGY